MLNCRDPELQRWIDEINQALPRCLGLLDRQPLSRTFGCFDKDFWHFRTKDFATAASQMSALSLAKILDLQEQNILSSSWSREELLMLVQAGFDYTWSLQHSDGSFDEWYPNERGWGGPGGYVLYALCEIFEILKKYSSSFDSSKYLDRILLSARFQSGRPESGTLANHYAISLLALEKAYYITSDIEIKHGYQKLRESFLRLCSEEGWSLEYDGFDASYNLATVSFLSRLTDLYQDDELKEYCRRSIKFISLFVYPDGDFSGAPSSRHTCHNYPYAWAFWSSIENIAAEVTKRSLQGSLFSKTPRIADQDDHYIHYRLWDYLDAISYLIKRPLGINQQFSVLPWEKPPFTEDFPEAGVLVSLQARKYLVLSYKRGGAFVLFDLDDKKRIPLLNNYLLREKSGNLLSPQFVQQQTGGRWRLENKELIFEGKFECLPVFNQVFSPIKNILFRVFLGVVQIAPFSAHFSKGVIRRLMILDRKPAKARLIRVLRFSEQKFFVKDLIEVSKVNGQTLCRSTEVFSRYVPQSRYFSGMEKSESLKVEDLKTEWITEVVF